MDDGPNTYAYSGSNPVNYIDPDGLSKRRPGAPSPGQGIINLQVNSLIRQIRQIDTVFRYQTIRPIDPQGRYTQNNVNQLRQFLSNAQTSGFCGPGASSAPGFLNNGSASLSNIYTNIVPPGTTNRFTNNQFNWGFRFQWNSNGTRFRLWGHSPNPKAPAGSYSRNNPIVTLQVNNRFVTSNGNTVGNPRTQKNAHLVHIF